MTNCICEYSANQGVRVNATSPTFRGNQIHNNSSYGVYIFNTPTPDLGANNVSDKGRNSFQNNDGGNYQVSNLSSSTVNAYYNYWGYTSGPTIDSHIYDNEEASVGEVYFDPFLTSDESLPVQMTMLTAAVEIDGVVLQWITESETDVLGFHVWRGESEAGPFQQITSEIIEGAGNTSQRHEYSFKDTQVEWGKMYVYYIECLSITGESEIFDPISVFVQTKLPSQPALFQNFPNPFNPKTTIRFDVHEETHVSLNIFDVKGREVLRLVNREYAPGSYHIILNGDILTSGIYYYRIQMGYYQESKKMMILK